MGKPTLIFILFLVVATIGALVYIKNPRPYKIAWASIVLGNREHYLDCSDLPFFVQVEKALVEHQELLENLRRTDGVVGIEPQAVRCYTLDGQNYFNKGDILITYANQQARKEVDKLIGENFFGIPWRGHKK